MAFPESHGLQYESLYMGLEAGRVGILMYERKEKRESDA